MAVFVSYMTVALPLGHYVVNHRPFVPIASWLRSGRSASEEEVRQVLTYPKRWALQSIPFWTVGAAGFAVLNIDAGPTFAVVTAVTIVLGAATACALQYLLVERILRPVVAHALGGSPPPESVTASVSARVLIAWGLGTAVPLLGVTGLAALQLAGDGPSVTRLAGALLALSGAGLAVGLLSLRVAGRSVADPLSELRDAVRSVDEGDFSCRVTVDDGSEVGLLQAGFNSMVQGLEERERLREAFGTYVDPVLADRVLDEGVDLAGEEVEVSMVFLDVRNFTAFAESARPAEVVKRLNRLFDLVVPIVVRHGGHANKYIGDGLLAVFGAPDRLPDHATRAVASACEVVDAVHAHFGSDVQVGIGVNTGTVVVGTVGGGGHLEFTVIGDAVNTAARVESATRETDDEILITQMTFDRLSASADQWEQRPAIPLKGKTDPVPLYAPRRVAPRNLTTSSSRSSETL